MCALGEVNPAPMVLTRTWVAPIFSKADLRDRGQAVAYAFRNGLASP